MKIAPCSGEKQSDKPQEMTAQECELHLVGKCQYGRKCQYAHVKIPQELSLMTDTVELTVLVQRAWPRRVQSALTAWTLMQSLLRRSGACSSFDLLVYDSDVMRAVDFQQQLERGTIADLRSAFLQTHERFGPDRFFQPLSQMIAAICKAAQHRHIHAAPVARQLIVFTYTGAVADYGYTGSLSELVPMMQAAHLSVIVVGVELSDAARQSLAHVCDGNDPFVFFDGKPSLASCHNLNRVSARAHGNTVLSVYRALGPHTAHQPHAHPPDYKYFRSRAQLFTAKQPVSK